MNSALHCALNLAPNLALNSPRHRCISTLLACVAASLLLLAHPLAVAAPGAHGPNGEHLDAPTTPRNTSTLPRVEAQSDLFELVAQLRAGEMSIVVDRYETNEPVLGAKLDIESGTLKAVAAFRAEQGDYVVSDAALLQALAAPGEHGLVFTLITDQDSDLLDATLVNATGTAAGSSDDLGHSHGLDRAAWLGAVLVVLGLIGSIAWWRTSRAQSTPSKGGQ